MTGLGPSWLAVGVGGFTGSVARYLVAGAMERVFPGARVPMGTLVVNVLGCGLIGALAALIEFRGVLGPQARLLLLVGVLGGFTTFSSFGYETLELVRRGQFALGLANAGLQVLLGLTAVWLGHTAMRLL